jgi:hypothetical protein
MGTPEAGSRLPLMNKATLKAEEAVGKVRYHGIMTIVRGTFKRVTCEKGHAIQRKDGDTLYLGKSHISLIERDLEEIHEVETGWLLATASAGAEITMRAPSEGGYDLMAKTPGRLKIKTGVLRWINGIPNGKGAT